MGAARIPALVAENEELKKRLWFSQDRDERCRNASEILATERNAARRMVRKLVKVIDEEFGDPVIKTALIQEVVVKDDSEEVEGKPQELLPGEGEEE